MALFLFLLFLILAIISVTSIKRNIPTIREKEHPNMVALLVLFMHSMNIFPIKGVNVKDRMAILFFVLEIFS